MVIGLLILDIHFPYSHSLKEKRKNLLSIRERMKKKYNVAYAELDFQEKWQRTRIGLVTLNSKKGIIDRTFHQVLLEISEKIDGEILHHDIHYY
jgi:uncharacterized protein YlxP (DUF503 family)